MRDPVFKRQKNTNRMRDIVTPAPQSAPEASTIRYPPSTPVPPVAVLRQSDAGHLTSPVPQTFLAPASSAPVLNNTVRACPSHSFLFPPIRSDRSPSHHRSMITTTCHPPSANRGTHANATITLNPRAPPPFPPLLGTELYGAIPGRSGQEPNVGRSRPSRRWYDIVKHYVCACDSRVHCITRRHCLKPFS
jgi:hypothetical protein